jgi:dUTP pyrophosphatase
MKLKVQRIHRRASLPEYKTAGAACLDIRTIEHGEVESRAGHVFRTGLQVEVPAGYVLLIFSRSGHGFNNDLRLANCVGVIDSDYRGEILVKLTNDSPIAFGFEPGDRIAQAMLVQIPRVEIEESSDLSETERGDGGFGSTGNN